jgi:type I restriction enzyme S subunit
MSLKKVKLKEVAIVNAGNSAPQADSLFKDGIYNFYRTSDVGRIHKGFIDDSADKLNDEGIKGLRLFSVGTILFPKSGASTFLNHRVLMKKAGYVSSHLATIKAKNDLLDDMYLYYLLTTIDAKELIQDSSYPSLKTSAIENIELNIPSLEVQRKVVERLDLIFDEISKASAAITENSKKLALLEGAVLNQAFNGNLIKD